MTVTFPVEASNGTAGADGLPECVRRVLGEPRRRLHADLHALRLVGDRLVLLEEGGRLRQWSVPTGDVLDATEVSDLEPVWAIAPDGRTLASGGRQVSLWDAADGTVQGQLGPDGWVTSLAFDPGGTLLAAGYEDHSVRLFETEGDYPLWSRTSHADEVCALAFSADSTLLAVAGEDRVVTLLDVADGAVRRTLAGHTDRIDALCFSPDGTLLASAGWDRAVRVWSVADGELLAMLNDNGECVHSVVFTGADTLVCGDSAGVVRWWQVGTLEVLAAHRHHAGPVRLLTFDADGGMLASGGGDRVVRFWSADPHAAQETDAHPAAAIRRLVCDAGLVTTLHRPGRLFRWQAANGAAVSPPLADEDLTALDAAGGRWAVGTQRGTVQCGADGDDSREWAAHREPVSQLALDPTGTLLATTAGMDGTVKLWRTDDGEPVFIIPEAVPRATIETLRFHPTRPIVAVSGINWSGALGDGGTVCWDHREHRAAARVEGAAAALAFSPDGTLLACVDLSGTVLVWDWQGQRLLRELGGSWPVATALFSPDGARLIGVGSDGLLRTWRTADWAEVSCVDLGVGLVDAALTGAGRLITANANACAYVVDLPS